MSETKQMVVLQMHAHVDVARLGVENANEPTIEDMRKVVAAAKVLIDMLNAVVANEEFEAGFTVSGFCMESIMSELKFEQLEDAGEGGIASLIRSLIGDGPAPGGNTSPAGRRPGPDDLRI